MSRSTLLFFITVFITACGSEAIRVGDGKIEPSLEKHTGITGDRYTKAREKQELDLKDLFALAVENTQRLAIQEERLNQAKAKEKTAYRSWLPSLSLRHQESFIYPDHSDDDRRNKEIGALVRYYYGLPQDLSDFYSTSSSLPPYLGNGTRLVLNIPITTGLNEISGIQSSKAGVKRQENLLRYDAGRLYLELARSYYTILQLEANIKSAEELHRLTEDTIGELRRRVSIGRSRQSELVTAKSRYEKQVAELADLKNQLNQERSYIAFLAGIAPQTPLVDFPLLPPPDLSESQALTSLQNRYDIKAAEAAVKVAEADLYRAWGGHFPQLNVAGYYGIPGLNKSTNRDIYGQIALTFPIFSFGAVQAEVERAEAALREAKLTADQTRRSAEDEVRKAYDSYQQSGVILDSYEKALQSAETNYRLQRSDYSRQLNTILDLLTALSDLESARKDAMRSDLQQRLNRIWVGVATGELPETGQTSETHFEKKEAGN